MGQLCRKGFTLLELLVVILIIGVLLAILLPVFARAQEKGRQATCTSNLRQLGMAFRMYLNDYGGNRPPDLPALAPEYLSEPKILRCASDPTGNFGWLTRNADVGAKWAYPTSYSYFFWLDLEWNALSKLDSKAGYVLDRNHGSETRSVATVSGNEVTSHGGVTLRLNFDGSVVVRNFPFLRTGQSVGGSSYWEMLTANPGQPTPPPPFGDPGK